MRITTASEHSARTKWQQAARGVLTVGLLSAVAVAGFFLLGSEILAASTAPSSSEPQLASGAAFAELVNFEAPAATVARLKTATQEAQKSSGQANAPLLLKNWRYTQQSFVDLFSSTQPSSVDFYINLFEYSWAAFAQGTIILYLDSLSPASTPLLAPQYQIDLLVQSFTNSLLPVAYRSPPLPPASPTL